MACLLMNFHHLCKNEISFLSVKLHVAINLPSIFFVLREDGQVG